MPANPTIDGFSFEGQGVLERIDTYTASSGKEILTLFVHVAGRYPKTIPCKMFGKSADKLGVITGMHIKIEGYLGGNEWKGKMYPEVIATHVYPVDAAGGAPAQQPLPTGKDEPPPPSDDDSIPF
jgi:hypothetical protein